MKLALSNFTKISFLCCMTILANFAKEPEHTSPTATSNISSKMSLSEIQHAFEQATIIINKQLENPNYVPGCCRSAPETFMLYKEILTQQYALFKQNPNLFTHTNKIILNPYTNLNLHDLLIDLQNALNKKWTISSKLTHSLSALAIGTATFFGIKMLNKSQPMIASLQPLQNPSPLQLDESFRTYFVNQWITPMVKQYNDTRTNTVDCINQNITAINSTIANINQNIKIASIAGVVLGTTAALYFIYKHYVHTTYHKPVKEILFKIYTILTNQGDDKAAPNKIYDLVLELKTYIHPKQNLLEQDLNMLADPKVCRNAKILIIQRMLDQYDF